MQLFLLAKVVKYFDLCVYNEKNASKLQLFIFLNSSIHKHSSFNYTIKFSLANLHFFHYVYQ